MGINNFQPKPASKLDTFTRPTTQAEASYAAQGSNTQGIYYGININDYKDYTPFDTESVFITPFMDDTRAENQSATEQVFNGVGRFVGTTATKFGAGIGYIGGFVGWAGTGFQDISTMTDNGFSAFFDNLEQDIKDAAPIYKPSYVENGGFWDKVGSLGFWMDEGVDGFSFLASALLTGGATTALGIGGRVANIIGKGVKTARTIDQTLMTVLNTVSESAVEAKGVQDRVRQELQDKVDRGLMTPEQMEVKAAEAARADFITNALILAGPNALQTKMFFGDFTKAAERNVLKKIIDKNGSVIKDVGPVTKNLVLKNVAKNAGKSILSEGAEEGLQLAAEETFVDDAVNDKDLGVLGSASEIAGKFIENFGTTEGQISMFLGAVMGVGGGVVGGIKEGRAEKKAIKNAQARLSKVDSTYVADLKSTLRDIYETEEVDGKEVLKKDEQGNLIVNLNKAKDIAERLEKSGSLEAAKQVALLKGDKEVFKYLQNITFANLAIEHLQYGEGSLEILEKRLDYIAEQNKQEYEEIYGLLGENAAKSIEEDKEVQKAVARKIYDTLEKQKDFSGVWSAPEIKDKKDLKAYDAFVQQQIGKKALADGIIEYNKQRLQKLSKPYSEAKTALESSKLELNRLTSKLEESKNLLESIEKGNLETEVKIDKAQLKEDISELEKEVANASDKMEEFKASFDTIKETVEAIEKDKKELEDEFGKLSNKTLKTKIQSDWNKLKAEIDAANKKKNDEKITKTNAEQKETNGTSNSPVADQSKIEALKAERDELLKKYTAILEEWGTDETPEAYFVKREIDELTVKIEELENNGSANATSVIEKENDPEQAPAETIDIPEYNPVISKTMVESDELNPEKAAAKPEVISESVGNSLETVNDNPNGLVNVVMHKQLMHSIKKVNNRKVFFFSSDSRGLPQEMNSDVDYNYVNNPLTLQPGSEVEFRIIELNENQKKEVDEKVKKSIEDLKKIKAQGIEISEENNWGFGDTSKAIGIYSEGNLIGYVQMPHSFNTSEASKIGLLNYNRNYILETRKVLLDKLSKGEKVTTKIADKGKGNFFSSSIDEKINVKNQDGSLIKPVIREIDKVAGQSIYGYYDNVLGTWVVQDFSNKTETKKALEQIRKDLTGIPGHPGQVALMVKTANNTWSPVPVFVNTISEETVDELFTRLVDNKDSDAATIIGAINDLVYATMDDSGKLNIFTPKSSDVTYIKFADGYKIDAKLLERNEAAVKEKLRELRYNLVSTRLNTKSYQDMLLDKDMISTSIVPINDQYFIQPYIQFESILPKSTIPNSINSKVESSPTPTTQTDIKVKTTESKVEVISEKYTPELLRANLDKLFLFGDNNRRTGKGGQAIIRDEPNAMGISTKLKPSNASDAFMSDDQLANNRAVIDSDIKKAKDKAAKEGKTIVLPKGGFGTGLAALATKAPQTFAYLNQRLQEEFGFNNTTGELATLENKPATTDSNILDIPDDLGLETGYISSLDTDTNINVNVNGKNYTINSSGQVLNDRGVIIKTEGTVNQVLKQEALSNNQFVDTADYRALAVLTNKNGMLQRKVKILSLQTNREITSQKEKDKIAIANPAIGELIRKNC